MNVTIEPQFKFAQPAVAWLKQRPALALALLVLAALGPFIAKPFSIDDPLFVWTAKHIQNHPADPYGFKVNWYGYPAPMWQVTKNPPLACYYLAVAGSVFGWSEIALHLAFLVPALAAILGTYRLARSFCERPLFAAGATLFTPVFLVSATSLMCDTLMLAFWVWAIVLWIEGSEKKNGWQLLASAVLATLAAYTKYFGVCLIPLLAVHSLIEQRRIGWRLAYFLVPIVGLIAYQRATGALYGRGLLSDAGEFAVHLKVFEISPEAKAATALAFTGGCFALATFLTPWIWRPKVLARLGLFSVALTAVVLNENSFWQKYQHLTGATHIWIGIQMAVWIFGGASLLTLAAMDALRRRDPSSILLFLWVGGTFIFAGFLNWTLNGRSILPMAPAVGILLARRLETDVTTASKTRGQGAKICFFAGVVLALMAAVSDLEFALASRQSARETVANFGHQSGSVWFEGHWGWQYYLESLGAKVVTDGQLAPPPSDYLALPSNNTHVILPGSGEVSLQETMLMSGPQFLATFNSDIGAGFYASVWGPLPFAFGNVPPQKIYIYSFKPAP
jgi:4-amino-4-deoxy-L-arabinose transferase-like glycosyltransferase